VNRILARLRLRRPKPWECRHQWQRCPVVVVGKPGRFCPRCNALEVLCDTQPAFHPESMAVLLPEPVEARLAALDERLWPGEYL
jgi:hypothetical protein